MDTEQNFVEVVVPRPLRKRYVYALDESVEVGSRVRVSLGFGETIGIVVSKSDLTYFEGGFKLKPILKCLDEVPLLDLHLMKFMLWVAQYYQFPVGEVVFLALPKSLKGGQALKQMHEIRWLACQPCDDKALQRAPKQKQLHQKLKNAPLGLSEEVLRMRFGNTIKTTLKALQAKNMVHSQTRVLHQRREIIPTLKVTHPLTKQQQACYQALKSVWDIERPLPFLLHGITGSGKTELYIHWVRDALLQQKQVLLLLPEIGLTPQLFGRFQTAFPDAVIACTHSKLNHSERLLAWVQGQTANAHILMGTRSAVFSPLPDLGLIIVDEEHDLSFKQQEGLRYQARDLAVKRAQMLNIPIVLGSATPSLESLWNAKQERYGYYFLNERPGQSTMATVQIQDVRHQNLTAGLSAQTMAAIEETLAKHQQVMVFINRRGFSPALMCQNCGWFAHCEACNSNMAYHAHRKVLHCHRCDHEQTVSECCPYCAREQLSAIGIGTERVELYLKQCFPDVFVGRIDRDSIGKKGTLERLLSDFQSQDSGILIGTQMLAKGHDFERLSLVVILEADGSLMTSEFHATERFAQLFTQVSGRAGRGRFPGSVILQTTQPDHPFLQYLIKEGYPVIADLLLQERQQWHFPPMTHQALIRASANEMEDALDYLKEIQAIIQEQPWLIVMGPSVSPIEKKAGRYRAHLLLQSANRKALHDAITDVINDAPKPSAKKQLRYSIDIDPVELL